jgi:hypothetical protein
MIAIVCRVPASETSSHAREAGVTHPDAASAETAPFWVRCGNGRGGRAEQRRRDEQQEEKEIQPPFPAATVRKPVNSGQVASALASTRRRFKR